MKTATKTTYGTLGVLTPAMRRELNAAGFGAEATGGHSKRGFARENADSMFGTRRLVRERVQFSRLDGSPLTAAHVAAAKAIVAAHAVTK